MICEDGMIKENVAETTQKTFNIAAKKKRILYVLVKENIVQLFKLFYILRLVYCA